MNGACKSPLHNWFYFHRLNINHGEGREQNCYENAEDINVAKIDTALDLDFLIANVHSWF